MRPDQYSQTFLRHLSCLPSERFCFSSFCHEQIFEGHNHHVSVDGSLCECQMFILVGLREVYRVLRCSLPVQRERQRRILCLTFQMRLIFCSLFFLVCVNLYPDHEQRSMLTISICCQKSNMISRVKTKSMIGGRLRSLMPVHDMLFLDGLALHGDDDPWCNFLFKIDIEMSHSLIIICRSVAQNN